MSQQNFRYPGVQPFQRSQADRFFGRNDDRARFLSLILQEKLCVLYGKSGYGKSSLLNAGIQPDLVQESAKGKRRYVAVPVRFHAAGGQGDDNLYEQFRFHLGQAMEAAGIPKATYAADLPHTLWGCFKSWQTEPGTVFVLLFDQFEELFSYKPEEQLAFRQQLAELLYSDYPQFLEENEPHLPPETLAHLAEKTNVHVVLAIRADRVSELDRLRDHLSKIREKWFELRALPLEEAARALSEPAALPGDFVSPTFQFEESAQRNILDFLRDSEGLIDPIQLQILAESFEQRAIREGLSTFHAGNIGDLHAVIARYYSDKIAAISDSDERLAARRLCEEGLAQEGEPPIRLSLHAAQIRQFFGIEAPLLSRLVDARLLRAEAGKGGGATYELPHDTLLGAVLEAKKVRQEQERKAAAARAAEELALRVAEAEARAAEEKRRAEEAERLRLQAEVEKGKAQKMSKVAIGMTVLACMGLLVAAQKYNEAESEREKTEEAITKVEQTLLNLKAEQAEKLTFEFEDKERRTRIILEGGGCARELLADLEQIAAKHPDSLQLRSKLQSLYQLNPACK